MSTSTETFDCPNGRYTRLHSELAGFTREAVGSGRVLAAEDIDDPNTRERLMLAIERRGSAYPLGFSVEIESGVIVAGWGWT